MKKILWYIMAGVFLSTLFGACSQQKEEQTLESMLKDAKQQEKVLTLMAENHELSDRYINEMMKNDHATGMMVDKLVTAASEDSVLASKLSNMITKFPDLMLLTTHHFMPIINSDEHMCDGFCDHAMEHSKIAEGMCHKVESDEKMSCCK